MEWFEYSGIVVALLAGLVAVRGDTWNAGSKTWYRKLNPSGWVTVALVLMGACLTAASIVERNRRSTVAVLPVVSGVRQVRDASARGLVFDRIARNIGDPRSLLAKEIIALKDFDEGIKSGCSSLTSAWDNWKGEIDPRARGDVEMLVIYCNASVKFSAEMFFENSDFVHQRVCEFHSSEYACVPVNLAELEAQLTRSILSRP